MIKKYSFVTFPLMSFFVLLGSCDSDEEYASKKTQNNLVLQVEKLSSEIKSIGLTATKSQVQAIDEIDKLKKEVNNFKNEHPKHHQSVVFNAKQNDGFLVLDSSYGQLFVMVKEIKAHLDGHKITFSIGNPSGASFTDTKIKLQWNRPYPLDFKKDWNEEDFIQHDNWMASLKTKEFNISKELTSGCWTEVELFITPSDSKELEYVVFSIEMNTVLLTRANRNA